MRTKNGGVNYKIDVKYPNVRFQGMSVSQPVRSVEYSVGYWVTDLTEEKLKSEKLKYTRTKKYLLNSEKVSVFKDKYIHWMDFPETIKAKKCWIGFKFHFFTKGEGDIKEINEVLCEWSKDIYENILK
jgi:hypothetical protein